jgi:predicted Zn-dependent protease
MTTLDNFLKLIDGPRDGALLRFSIGNEYLKAGNPNGAVEHLREAVNRDPKFSVAWKLLGKALTAVGDNPGALDAYRNGITAAEARGDVQAAKEMKVFARRVEKAIAPPATS